jgi:hypothetical protein
LRRTIHAATLFIAFVLHGPPALGQDDPEKPAEIDPQTEQAIKHFKKGVKFFEKEKYEAALVEFLKSHELRPNWALRYNIGVCYEETGRPVEALDQFKLYLVEGADKLPEDRRAEVQQHIDELEQDLGFIVLTVSEDGAQVRIDEFRRFETPVPDPIPVEAGFHTIEVHKEGFKPHEAKFTVASDEEVAHEVELEELEAGEKDIFTWDETLPPEEPVEEPRRPLTGIWIGLGAGGALAIAAAGTGGAVLAEKNEMKDAAGECEVTLTRDDCPAAYKHQDKAKGLMIAANVLWALAGAAAVTGLVVYLTSKPKSEAPPEPSGSEPEVSVVPVIVPDKAGATLGVQTVVTF